MKIVLVDEAEAEFWESVAYYEQRWPGLGTRFKEEVDLFLEKIEKDPLLPRLRKNGYRRVNLSVFRLREEVLWVVAICHGHQKPEFWLDRISRKRS
jgi:hypothetical protein